jgi:hypothetical protein
MASNPRIDWASIIERAAEIVRSYDTGVTLRQLFYRLVSEQLIPNVDTSYKRLSALTAQARRDGAFPELVDRGRHIHRSLYFDDVAEALAETLRWYRLDRTIGQDVSVYLGVEKAGIVEQLRSWFGDYGIPVLALGGYSSQSYVGQVVADVQSQRLPDRLIDDYGATWDVDTPNWRPAVLLYAGDFDPSGEDIDRDFVARTGCWDKVIRVALSAEQVQTYRLPPNPGKVTDSRAAAFTARHGQLVQVELDALDPVDLRRLYTDAIAQFWDTSAYDAVLARERADLAQLRAIAGTP